MKTDTGYQCETYFATGNVCPGCEKCAPLSADAERSIEYLMDAIQEYASAWSLVGGQFDSGQMLGQAESTMKRIQTMLENDARALAAALAAAPVQAQPAAIDVDPTTKEQYRRMFTEACADLGLINEALGLDPDDGGADPILEAIEELKASAAQPGGGAGAQDAGKVFHHYGLSAEEVGRLLDRSLKPEEIAGPDDTQHDRIGELVRWFARFAQGSANPKWLSRHACELAYFIATHGVNRHVDLEAIRKAAFKEGVNITPEERGMLERIGFAAPTQPSAPVVAEGDEPTMLWDAKDDESCYGDGPDDFANNYASNCMIGGDVCEVDVLCAYRGSTRTMRITVSKNENDEEIDSPIKWEWVAAAPAAPTAGEQNGEGM